MLGIGAGGRPVQLAACGLGQRARELTQGAAVALVEGVRVVQVGVEAGHALGKGVRRQAGQCGRAAQVAEHLVDAACDVVGRVVDLVGTGLAFQLPGLAPPGGVAADLAGPVVRQILEQVGVDRLQVAAIELADRRAGVELSDPVGDEGGFAPFGRGIRWHQPTACLIAAVSSSLVNSPAT